MTDMYYEWEWLYKTSKQDVTRLGFSTVKHGKMIVTDFKKNI